MEIFYQLFGRMLAFVYHCFDGIVINGYLSSLSRPELAVYFFHQVFVIDCIPKETQAKRTREYQSWVESYARNQGIPMEWAQPKVRKEDYVQFCQRRFKRKNQTGVYFIFKSMEQGPTFRCSAVRWLIHSSIISLIGSFHSTAAWSAPIIKRMLTFKKSLTYFMLPNRRDKLSQ